MNRTVTTILLSVALCACASTPSAREVERLGTAAIVGEWTSELDHSVLTVSKDGRFTLTRGSVVVTGRWSNDAGAVVFSNDGVPCADIDGAYTPEVVRDTVRFTKRGDDCAEREERMAWPWKRGRGANDKSGREG